ncbi:MAG: hypothetical protein ABR508_06875, partial [Candidatus Baltobacteraceae bacterium]
MHRLRAAAAALSLTLIASAQHAPPQRHGSFALAMGTGPFISGSRILLTTTGAPGRVSFTVSGAGTLTGAIFTAPA